MNGQVLHSQFVIGSHGGDERIVTLRKRDGRQRVGVVTGVVENKGTASFTVSAFSSSDNDPGGDGDDYSAVTFRTGGGNATSVTVVPGGIAEFGIEALADQYVEFRLGSGQQTSAAGVLTLNTARGEFTEVGQTGVAYPDTEVVGT